MSDFRTYEVPCGNGATFKLASNVREAGDDWLICLHGIQSNRKLFDDWFHSKLLADYSLIAVDQLGFGDSQRPRDFSYDIREQADLVEALVGKLAIDRLHIVGHSLGGMIGALLLRSLGSKVISFVNAEGNLVLSDCGLSKRVAEKSFEAFTRERMLESVLSELRASNDADAQQRASWLQDTDEVAFYRTCQSIVRWSQSGELLELMVQSKCPTMFIYGSENRKKTAVLPSRIRIAEIENAGHFMIQSHPERSLTLVAEFLAGLEPDRRL